MTASWLVLRSSYAALSVSALATAVITAGSSPAKADCTPAANGGIIATCFGVTIDQGSLPPGSTGATDGYGTGAESGITVDVLNGASVTGSDAGFRLGDAAITIGAGATVSGANDGIHTTGAVDITNAGNINGSASTGVYSDGIATVRNLASGQIFGASYGIYANNGVADVINSGIIDGTIYGGYGVALTNNAGAQIIGRTYGILTNGSGSYVINAGTITASSVAINFSGSDNTLTLLPGSSIIGDVVGAGNDTFQFGGVGSASFDTTQFGTQYTGFGTINKVGSSTWTLNGSGSGFSGAVNINDGTLSISSLNAGVFDSLGNGLVTMAGGTLQTTATGTLANDLAFATVTSSTIAAATGTTLTIGTPTSAFNLNGFATAVFGSPTDGGVILFDSTILPMVDLTSAVVVGGGTLQDNLTNLYQLLGDTGSVTVNSGAVIDYNDALLQIINNLNGAGTVATGATGTNQLVLFGDAGRTNLFSGAIAGSHPVQIDGGKYIFSGTNTYTGDTFICFCATLQIGNGGTTGSILSSTVFNGGELTFNRSNTYVFGGMIVDFATDAGHVTQAGTGTTVFTADNT